MHGRAIGPADPKVVVAELVEKYRQLFIDGEAHPTDLEKVRKELSGKGHGTAVVDAVLRDCEQIRLKALSDFATIAAKGVAGALSQPTTPNIRAVISDPSFKARAIIKGAAEAEVIKGLADELRADPVHGGPVVRAALGLSRADMGSEALPPDRQADIAYGVLGNLAATGELTGLSGSSTVQDIFKSLEAGRALQRDGAMEALQGLQDTRAFLAAAPGNIDPEALAKRLSIVLQTSALGAGGMLRQMSDTIADPAKWADTCLRTLGSLDEAAAIAKPELQEAVKELLAGMGVSAQGPDAVAAWNTSKKAHGLIAANTKGLNLREADLGRALAAAMRGNPGQAETLLQATRGALSSSNALQSFDAASAALTDAEIGALSRPARDELLETLRGGHLSGSANAEARAAARAERGPLARALLGGPRLASDSLTDAFSGLNAAKAQARRLWWLAEGTDSPRAAAYGAVATLNDEQLASRLAEPLRAGGTHGQSVARYVLHMGREASAVPRDHELLSADRRSSVQMKLLQDLDRSGDLARLIQDGVVRDLVASRELCLRPANGVGLPAPDPINGFRAAVRARQIIASSVTSTLVLREKAGSELAAAIMADPANGGVMLRTLRYFGGELEPRSKVITTLLSSLSDADLRSLDPRLLNELRAEFPGPVSGGHVDRPYVARLEQAIVGR